LVLELSRCTDHGAGEHHGHATTARPCAREPVLRILVRDRDLARIDSELLAYGLGHDRLRTVAPEWREHRDDELAGRPETQPHALRRRREPGALVPEPELGRPVDAPLLGGRKADADVAALFARVGLHASKPGIVRHLDRLLEDRGVIAAVVDVSAWRLEREEIGFDEVLPSDLHRVDAQLLRGAVHEALETEIAGIGAGSAEDALLALVGQHALNGVFEARHPVGAGDLGERVAMRPMAELEVGAVVVEYAHADALEDSVARDGELGLVEAVAREVLGGEEIVDTVLHELDRA